MARLRPVGRLDPGCRLLGLAFVSSSVFFCGPLSSSLVALFLALLVLLEGVSLARLLKESSYIALLAIFSLALQCVGWEGGIRFRAEYLPEVLRYAARLLAAFMAGRLFYASTGSGELRVAAVKAGRLLPGRLKGDAALALVLTLGFIPLVREEWEATALAAASRGLGRRGSLSARIEFLAAFLRRIMTDATKIPEALASRGWEGGGKAPELRVEAWRAGDWAIAAALAACLAAAIVLRPN